MANQVGRTCVSAATETYKWCLALYNIILHVYLLGSPFCTVACEHCSSKQTCTLYISLQRGCKIYNCIRQRLTPRVHRPDCAWRRLAWFPHASVLPCAPRESRCLSKQWSVWRGRGQHLPNDIAATRNTPARLASAWATLRMRRMAAVAKR